MIEPLNIFYEEPDPDRWVKYDRFPRKLVRRLLRGPEPIGGVKRWFLNLIHGLDLIDYPYTINDYESLKKDFTKWAFVVGKPHVIEKIPDNTNIIYGPGIASHPCENAFWDFKKNIKHILISSDWFKQMYDRDLPVHIPTSIWASGIDTYFWKPNPDKSTKKAILIYDKIRWEWERYKKELLDPIYQSLEDGEIKIHYIKYGFYNEKDFKTILNEVDGMIFLCEHETQGFAYLQALSCDIPVMAWDRGGLWKDPYYYPDRVKFEPVSSVPYWDDRCGLKFTHTEDFNEKLPAFLKKIEDKSQTPREYIMENLTLEIAAEKFISITKAIMAE